MTTLRSVVLEPLLVALSFLTRLPLLTGKVSPQGLHRSLAFFPLVGLLLGAVLATSAWLLHGLPERTFAATLLVALLAAMTGALHLDGVADLFDALGGGRGQAERMLEIMRDPRIGAHGATALCLVLVAKIQLFGYGLEHFDPVMWLLLPASSRLAAVPLVAFFPVARPDGLAREFHHASAGTSVAVAALSIVLVVASAFIRFLVPVLLALSVSLILGFWARRRLGGLTGDIYGAGIELAEVAFLASWTLFPPSLFRV